MKSILRKVFSPILMPLEAGEGQFNYKSSHRIVLIVIGCLFFLLATAIIILAHGEDLGYLIPVFVFYGVSSVAFIVGALGNNRAVSRIWSAK